MAKKLPKQWKRWVEKAGLEVHCYGKFKRSRINWYNLKGKNRYWRVSMYNDFQCSCPIEHFDRWANSYGDSVTKVPKTEKEFLRIVEILVDSTKDMK